MLKLFSHRTSSAPPKPPAPAAEAAPVEPSDAAPAENPLATELERATTALELAAQYLADEMRDLTREPQIPADSPQGAALNAHLAAVVERLRVLLTSMEAIVAQTGVGGARSSLRLKALSRRIEESNRGMQQVAEASEQIQKGVELVANAASEAAQVAGQVEELTASGTQYGEQAAEAAQTLLKQMLETSGQLTALVERVSDITRVSHVIDGIAAQTRLLALNAAIEAARAGEHGRGFAVVANEVRALAEKSGAQTREIGTLVREITAHLEPVQGAVSHSLHLMEVASQRTGEVGKALEGIRALARTSAQHMEQVAAAVEEQTALISSLYDSTRSAVEGVSGIQEEAGHIAQSTLGLSQLSEKSYQALDAFYVDTIFHRTLRMTRQLAEDGRRVFEAVIDQGKVSLEQVLEVGRYTEYKGSAIKSLARLFDVSRVPPTGFDPPKYGTAYDALIDERVQDLLDEMIRREPHINTCTLMDLDGYIPAHPRQFCKDWTGDHEKDLVGNRMKKIYLGASLRGARVGLPQAAALSETASRQDFLRAGCDLRESPEAAREFMVQTYARDTGEVVILVTVPMYVKGQRWGVATATWKAEG